MYPMGKKIVSKACSKDLDPHSFKHINQLKAFIKDNNKCGQLKEKQLQAVALYLWDIERKSGEHKHEFITVGKDEKCPVCGMFVYKYPRWAAKVTFTKDQNQSHAVFDGVKDLLKFYFNPAKWGDFKNIEIKNIDVTDYYTQKSIDGKTAYYVIGSDVYGPMGKEFIPFSSKADAETFIKDHQGQKILSFNQITEKLTYDQDD
jgi:nitrous oxide reductase accessory protein NosL